MYAIIETGSKQYHVEPNGVIQVEKLELSPETKEVLLDRVLMVRDGDKLYVGTPVLNKAKVTCEYLGDMKAPKVISFKYRRRKNSRNIKGHRQIYSQLRVKDIQVGV